MRWTPLFAAVLLLAAIPAQAEEFDQSVPVRGPGRLRLELDRGSVDVRTHREPNVQIHADVRGLGASSIRFEAALEGSDVVLRSRREAWLDWLSSGPTVQIQVWVPASFDIECASRNVLVTRRDAVEISYPTRAIGQRAR
jgi:hypothetical protein